MSLLMLWRAVCGESRMHGSEGAEESRGPSATLQQGLPKPRVGGSIPPRRIYINYTLRK